MADRMADRCLQDYCGLLSEEAVRKNFLLVYELLDEVIDYGFPQNSSSEALKEFVLNDPTVLRPVSWFLMLKRTAAGLQAPFQGNDDAFHVGSFAFARPACTSSSSAFAAFWQHCVWSVPCASGGHLSCQRPSSGLN